MALRINVIQYNKFVSKQRSLLLLQKTGPICLALVGLKAGWQADKIWADFKILKFSTVKLFGFLLC